MDVINKPTCYPLIQDNDYVIIKKDSVMKLHQVKCGRSVHLRKQNVTLNGVIGKPFGSLFEIRGNQLHQVDSLITSKNSSEDSVIGESSPVIDVNNSLNPTGDDKNVEIGDNRFLNDDGKSQKLTKDDIQALKDQGLSGKEIIQQLIDNSSTFKEKNKFSQVKYLKKKNAKYTNIVQVLQPTTRLIAEMYYGQDPFKIMNLRMDSLAQILTACNVHSGGQYLVMDCCMGLVTGAVLERLFGNGNVVRCFAGDVPVSNAIQAYNFTETELKCLHNIKYTELLQAENEITELCAVKAEDNLNGLVTSTESAVMV